MEVPCQVIDINIVILVSVRPMTSTLNHVFRLSFMV